MFAIQLPNKVQAVGIVLSTTKAMAKVGSFHATFLLGRTFVLMLAPVVRDAKFMLQGFTRNFWGRDPADAS